MALEFKKHPSEKIVIQLLNLLKNLFKSQKIAQNYNEIEDELMNKIDFKLSKKVVSSLSKDVLMFIFALVKKKLLTLELCGEEMNECLVGFQQSLSDDKSEIIKILEMIFTGLKQIIITCSKKVDKTVIIIEKILSLIDGVMNQHIDLLGERKLNYEQDLQWLSPIFYIITRLKESGSVKNIDHLYNKQELVIEKLQNISDEKFFIKELSKNVKEISEKKAETKQMLKEKAITDPKAFAKEKIKKSLRKRQNKKEKLNRYKFGIEQNDYKQKVSNSTKKIKTE